MVTTTQRLLERPRASEGAENRTDEECCRNEIGRFARPDLRRSVLGLATSLLPFLALWVLMYFALPVSYLLVLLLAVPAAGFLVRTYIIFHDCTHGSYFSSRRANAWVGSVLGLVVLTPFARWRHEHTVHHATSGDLDRRGVGDVPMMSVAEYEASSTSGRVGYRTFRNPFVMFGLGPIYSTCVMQRWAGRSASARDRRSVWTTNLVAAIAIGALCWWLGWQAFLLVEAPLVVLAGGAGIWLFYVQHQFEGTAWSRTPDWRFSDAALRGSSYLRLPRVLQFFTGNIGFHHVHHLNPRIPNYNLQRAHDEQAVLQAVPALSLRDGLRATRLKLWDERTGRLVPFPTAP
jgi:omega-6 fatty acid desaturase (delta-12 desaturase)